MNYLLSALYLVIVLGVLIFVHELGHFLAARFFRVRVEVFSLGFGPRLFGWRGKETDYRLSAVPLGGYCRMAGETGTPAEGAADDPGLFTSKPRGQRLAVLFAGPAMNVGLALVLWWALFLHGMEVADIPQGPPVVERAETGSPADNAGLQPGDKLVAIDGREIDSVAEYEDAILFHPGRTLKYRVTRDGKTLDKNVQLATHPAYGVGWDGVRVRLPILVGQVVPGGPADRAGVKAGDRILAINGRIPGEPAAVTRMVAGAGDEATIALLRDDAEITLRVRPERAPGGGRMIGVGVTYPTRFVRYGPVSAAGESVALAWRNAGLLFRTLWALVKRDVPLTVMSGPLEIARISREQAAMGVIPFLQLLAFISIQLGIFNLLPVPVLDGGHMLILLVESGLRRDVSMKWKERALQVGFVVLVVFAVAILALDFWKAIGRATADRGKTERPAAEAPRP